MPSFLNTSHIDRYCWRGSPRACSTCIACAKSERSTRISQPVLLSEVRLSASTLAASKAANTSLAWRSSRSPYIVTRVHATSSRQTSSAIAGRSGLPVPGRNREKSIELAPAGSGLLPEQLLHTIGGAVGHIGGELRLEQELVALHRHLEHLSRCHLGGAGRHRARQVLDLGGRAVEA